MNSMVCLDFRRLLFSMFAVVFLPRGPVGSVYVLLNRIAASPVLWLMLRMMGLAFR